MCNHFAQIKFHKFGLSLAATWLLLSIGILVSVAMASRTTSTSTSTIPSRVIEGALTTTFTPRNYCWSPWLWPMISSSTIWTEVAAPVFDPGCIPPVYQADGTPYSEQCYPPATRNAGRPFAGPYSPGLYCPSGWSMALTMREASPGSGHDYYLSTSLTLSLSYSIAKEAYALSTLLPGETAALCCPTGYQMNAADMLACTKRQAVGTITAFLCREFILAPILCTYLREGARMSN